MDEAQTQHTQTPLPRAPTSQTLPRSSAPRMGWAAAARSWALFPGKCGNSACHPLPLGAARAGRPGQQLLVSLRLWDSPGAAPSLPRDAEGMGNMAGMEMGWKCGEGKSSPFPRRISGIWSCGCGNCLSHPAPPSPQGPRDAQAALGMPQLPPSSRDASPAPIPGSEGGQEVLRVLQAGEWQGFVFIPDNHRGNRDLSGNPTPGLSLIHH